VTGCRDSVDGANPAGVSARGPLLPRLGRSGGHAQTPSGSGDKMDKDKMMDKKQ